MSEHLLVLCTCPDAATARTLAECLVEQRLAACVSLLPGVTSVYRWQEELHADHEVLLLAKTRRARYAAVQGALEKAHPYELPEIIAVPIEQGLEAYLAWIDAGVGGKEGT
jgi:periplasmic divalent cation tolerance protein